MATDDCVPAACTLPTAERPVRVAEFDAIFAKVRDVTRTYPTSLDVVFPNDVEPVARDLAKRESECCSFFSFTFAANGSDVVMTIQVPAEYTGVLDGFEARIKTARLRGR